MAERTTYTPEDYQTSFVDFYNMGGIDVQKAPDPDPDTSDPPPVTPNILAPVSGEGSGRNIFDAMSLSTGQPAFKVGTVDYVDYINNFEKNLETKSKTGVDRSLGGFGKWAAEQAKKPETMIGTGVGMAMGMPGLGALASVMGAKNRQRQYENASKIAATGGTGGTMFKIGGQTISRAPGTRRYEGTLAGVTQEQAAAVEAIDYNFIPGTFEENQTGFEGGGGYQKSGKSGLARIDGAIMDAYGNIHSASGMQGGTASQATALREKLYVDAMEKAGYSLAGVNVADAALEMKQALDAAARGGIGVFETVLKQDAGAYNKSLSRSQQFIESYLAKRHAKPIKPEEAPITKQSDIPSTAQTQTGGGDGGGSPTFTTGGKEYQIGTGTGQVDPGLAAAVRESERENKESDTAGGGGTRGGSSRSGDFTGNQTGRGSGPTAGGYGGTGRGRSGYNDGGLVGYAPGGAVGASPAGFVERPPSQVPEAATVADDKPMSVPEGTFVINAAAVEFAGEEDIAKMLNDAYAKAGKQGSAAPSKEQIDVAVSRGEVIVPPAIAKIIGYDRLEKINNRGKKETSKRIEENGQQPVGAAEGGFLSRLFGFGKEEPQLTSPPSEEAEIPKQGFAEKPIPEASTPLPPYTDFENTARDLLLLLEGNVSEGYVPKGRSNSGVTVGIGFDVGQHNPSDLEKMGLNTNLIAKLTPYLKKKGQAARDVLETVPLKLTEPEMEEVNRLALRSKYEKFEKNYPEYAKIPDAGKRAVMFSASYLGALKRYETFRKEFDKGQNLKRAIKVGLFGKIKDKGDPEYNRAEKALDWYSEYERENMQLPTPKPNSSATR